VVEPPLSPFRSDILAGKVAFITGGATGIGKQIARALGHHGAKVAIASRNAERLAQTAAELADEGIEMHFDVCDVRDYHGVSRVVDGILDWYGALDIVVNNAAGNFPALMDTISPNGFKAVVDIDLLGTYNVSKKSYEAWLRDHGGSVVNITAPFEQKGIALQAHVAAAKAGVDSLTRTCAVEWGGYGIRVNAIGPGYIADTEGVRRFTEALPASTNQAPNPLEMKGHGFDIGYLVLYFCTDAARFITGQVINVDRGNSTDQMKLWQRAR
jgi:peroxisomal 2,4-dienoyl-CoA reductase